MKIFAWFFVSYDQMEKPDQREQGKLKGNNKQTLGFKEIDNLN
jgi:hypothetical protein